MAATFCALYDRIVPAANKYMATLFNTSSTRKVVVRRVYRFTEQSTAVTGVLLEQELRFITARTAGTSVTPSAYDTNLALSAGITADTASTSVTEGTGNRALITRVYASTEETLIAELTTSPEGATAYLQDAQLIFWSKGDAEGITLRQNQGITVKNITSSTVGRVSYKIEFTDEAA